MTSKGDPLGTHYLGHEFNILYTRCPHNPNHPKNNGIGSIKDCLDFHSLLNLLRQLCHGAKTSHVNIKMTAWHGVVCAPSTTLQCHHGRTSCLPIATFSGTTLESLWNNDTQWVHSTTMAKEQRHVQRNGNYKHGAIGIACNALEPYHHKFLSTNFLGMPDTMTNRGNEQEVARLCLIFIYNNFCKTILIFAIKNCNLSMLTVTYQLWDIILSFELLPLTFTPTINNTQQKTWAWGEIVHDSHFYICFLQQLYSISINSPCQ